MGFPPQPQEPQPGYGPPPGQGEYGPPPSQGGYGSPQGGGYDPPTVPSSPYGPPGYSGPIPYGSPPEQPNKVLIIGVAAALAVILLAGGGYGVYAYMGAPDPVPTVALQTPSPSQSDAPSSSASGEPTSSPTSEPSADPTSEPSARPSTNPGESNNPEPGSPITHGEFPDWKFSLEGVSFTADKVGGWTYDTCATLDGQGELARNKCERAVELAYSAYSGHLRAVQVIMSFPSEAAAKTAATRLAKLSSKAVKWRRDQALDKFVYGKIRSGAVEKYVVVTVVTADRTARAKATKFHHYLQADHKNYFLFRDL
ncbi:hypothetical protein [Nonomuraea sp. B5E05]|uniref:hypothetical protein n=1 Tax=Nonomuraea sp. B5E05 TaxID=3153569 RepID=UPI003261AE4D